MHGEAARRMGERLAFIKRQPARVLEWRSWLGASDAVLRERCPRAERIVVEEIARESAPWWSPRRWAGGPAAMAPAAVPAGSADLLWANMALHFEADVEGLLRRWRPLIATDGFLMFSTLGPGSLDALRELYRDAGWGPALAPLVDMHDLGDMLVHAAFAEPVMDQEQLVLTWPDAGAALAELRGLGGNAAPDRFSGLRTPRWRERLRAALNERRGADGRVRLTLELVYGHAFCPATRPRVAPQTHIPVEQLRSLARAGRAEPPTAKDPGGVG